MPTRPKIQNSAQDNSAQFSVLKLHNSSHVLEGLKYVCFIIPKNQVSLAAQLRLCLVEMLNVTLLPFVHNEHD